MKVTQLLAERSHLVVHGVWGESRKDQEPHQGREGHRDGFLEDGIPSHGFIQSSHNRSGAPL